VIFIQSGFTGDPHLSIEKSIINLQNLVQEVTVVNPNADLVTKYREAQPDMILTFTGLNIPITQLQAIRHYQLFTPRKIKLAAYFVDDPYWTDVTGSPLL
jgi:hypothetical protein